MNENEKLEVTNETQEQIEQNINNVELQPIVPIEIPMDQILNPENQMIEENNVVEPIEVEIPEVRDVEENVGSNEEVSNEEINQNIEETSEVEEPNVNNDVSSTIEEVIEQPIYEVKSEVEEEINQESEEISELNENVKVNTLNEQNEQVDVEAIRYFKYGNDYYLIFTYGEKDEKGNEKLYIVQVLEELGKKVTRNITDIDEWNNIQKMVKESIKQIKKGNDNNVEKLPIYELNEIKIESPRSFKIDSKLVELLKTDIVDDLPLNDNQNNSEENNEYKEMYSALKEDHDATELLMDDLMEQLISYKEKYGELSE